MKTITIRDLHEKTGRWVRAAAGEEEIRITDRGLPIATLCALREPSARNPWVGRKLRAGLERARRRAGNGTPSEIIVAEMRSS